VSTEFHGTDRLSNSNRKQLCKPFTSQNVSDFKSPSTSSTAHLLAAISSVSCQCENCLQLVYNTITESIEQQSESWPDKKQTVGWLVENSDPAA